ncbi:transmembrane protein, putative (macronuclear) [Tetrahymena thermophila SB210]|uniref:Transmembrane protein, putative n=1 Tax=Tetrahymena thermophila (strain SB210) TaxID=312017 RepID=W7X5C5_TETTS|nr:transmembrane protein, putative [Tetrahymena thermophila SB210]EWS72607.1 transmembrane protein, putative [Tetrahymena thermophila SB210]|eukprot:XP_012654890.1 transmembrane protein, putative [Tetrahymena thermophila SB210]
MLKQIILVFLQIMLKYILYILMANTQKQLLINKQQYQYIINAFLHYKFHIIIIFRNILKFIKLLYKFAKIKQQKNEIFKVILIIKKKLILTNYIQSFFINYSNRIYQSNQRSLYSFTQFQLAHLNTRILFSISKKQRQDPTKQYYVWNL